MIMVHLDHLDRTLVQLVDAGRIAPEVAQEVSREFHTPHGDVRQRLAELAGYAGAALAVVGIAILGSQVWTDLGQVLRAGVPLLACLGLLIAARLVMRGVPVLADRPARCRLVAAFGTCASILGALTVVVAFPMPDSVDADRPWQPPVAAAVGLVIAFITSRWAPGVISTMAVAGFAFFFGISALTLLPLDPAGPGPAGLLLLLGGAVTALLLDRYFPPAWLTRLLGMYAWLQGGLLLLAGADEYRAMGEPRPFWAWIGRLGVVALVVVGSWLFAHGGEWTWAIGATLAVAMLVGLWSAQALNTGVALLVTGLVLIGVGAGLATWRRLREGRDTPPDTS